MKKVYVFFFLLFWGPWAYAETPGLPVLNIPVGAQAQAMGGATMALVEDVSAIHNNPSALSYMQTNELFFYYNKYMSDYRYNVFAYGHPFHTGQFAMGISVGYLSKGNFTRLDDQGVSNGEFEASDRLVSIAMSKKLGSSVSVGFGSKFVQSKIDAYAAQSFTFDFSSSYEWGSNTRFSLGVFHLGSSYKYLSQPSKPPTAYRMGLAHRLFNPLVITSQVQYGQVDQKLSFAVAEQLEIMKVAAVRFGYNSYLKKSGSNDTSNSKLDNLINFTMGLGFKFFSRVTLDYAFVPMGELGGSHSVDLAWGFK